MKKKIEILKEDVNYALWRYEWDLGNKVLYNLCNEHPEHREDNEIIAKFWLIGRAYAAAVERRRNKETDSDDFYENDLVEAIKKSSIDQWLSELPERFENPWSEAVKVIEIHKKLMCILEEITDLQKRSLVSKYLHFHKPELFFIYDSRAKSAIKEITPHIKEIRDIKVDNYDSEYKDFFRRCLWLKYDIEKKLGDRFSPRQIDTILLSIYRRNLKSFI